MDRTPINNVRMEGDGFSQTEDLRRQIQATNQRVAAIRDQHSELWKMIAEFQQKYIRFSEKYHKLDKKLDHLIKKGEQNETK